MKELELNLLEVSAHIRDMKDFTQEEREEIIERAREQLPRAEWQRVVEIAGELGNSETAYEIGGLPWSQGPPPGLLLSAVADYAMRAYHPR